MDFQTWFDELLKYADANGLGGNRPALIERYAFRYEDYYEEGFTPEDAYQAEWGHL